MKMARKLPIILLFALLFLFSFFLMRHTFSYNASEHTMRIGRKVWSDFGQHIPVIRSFSLGGNFDRIAAGRMPEFPLYPGEPMRYHFLFYALVGGLEKAGLPIDWALNIPSSLGFFLLLFFLFLLSRELLGNTGISVLTLVLFLFNGSLSFLRFFEKFPLSARSLQDVAGVVDFPSFAPWGPGDVSAFWNLNIYTNQRHLGLAFGICLALVWLLLRLERVSLVRQKKWIIPVSVTIGIYPFFHQPTLLIFAVIIATYFAVFPKLRTFLLHVGILTSFLVIPQLFLLSNGSKNIRWYPGYLIRDALSLPRFILYWWNNLGLHSVLVPIGFVLAPGRVRRALLPAVFIFIIANLFAFSVEPAANHKFFNFALLLGNIISAFVVVRLLGQYNHVTIKYLRKPLQIVAGAGLVGILTLSGIIDFFAVYNDTAGDLRDIPANEAATWIRDHTPKDAVFLNSSYFFHPASLSGRPIFLGWPYFAWSHGYTENRMPVMDTIYETRDTNERCLLLRKYSISFVTVENVKNDTNLPDIDLSQFLASYPPAYRSEDGNYAIFTTKTLCEEK